MKKCDRPHRSHRSAGSYSRRCADDLADQPIHSIPSIQGEFVMMGAGGLVLPRLVNNRSRLCCGRGRSSKHETRPGFIHSRLHARDG